MTYSEGLFRGYCVSDQKQWQKNWYGGYGIVVIPDCRVGLQIVEGQGYLYVVQRGLHDRISHICRKMGACKSIMPDFDLESIPDLVE